MSQFMVILLFISLIGLIAFTFYRYLRSKNTRNLILHLLLIIIYILVFFGYVLLNGQLAPKGGPDEHVNLIIALYFFIILGMLAHYGYIRLTQPAEIRKKFDLGYLLAPVLISPVVLFPLLTILQSAEIKIESLNVKLMFFLIAFENGFLWKEFFENHRQDKDGTGNEL